MAEFKVPGDIVFQEKSPSAMGWLWKKTLFFPVVFVIVISLLLTCSNKNPVDNGNPTGQTGRVVQEASLDTNVF
jgi:hypothetical protein